MTRHHGTLDTEIRRAVARLTRLGLLKSFEPYFDDRGDYFVAETAAGDQAEVDKGEALAYLNGLAQGSWVAQKRAKDVAP